MGAHTHPSFCVITSYSIHYTKLYEKEGKYQVQIFQDGINADRNGNDYAVLEKTVDQSTKMKFKLAPGGGFVLKLTKM